MSAPDIAALNAAMTTRILEQPAQPAVEGGYALRVLRSTGRRSGRVRETPLGVVCLDGRSYLVSPDPARAWVRNLDADPAAGIASADGTEAVTARRAPAAEAAPVVSAYLRAMTVPWALQAFPVPADASLEEITAHLDTIAVFRLDPR
ncbi:nitroreductase family deazaflavin-dependent oxidoreductase [Pseudonocardia halophobica]|uniref:nitroreductase family deazaflavin-dependent oxidoreductase n=1 Tax=Pseudonocardia halophobica TaxID=29401 RepID=UPI003D89D71E